MHFSPSKNARLLNCEKCIPSRTAPYLAPTTNPTNPLTRSYIGTLILSKLVLGRFFGILARPQGLGKMPWDLGIASEQKFAYNKNIIFWQSLSKLFYAKMPSSNFLFGKLVFTLILQHFAEALGPWGCVESKDGITLGVLI